MALDLEPGSYQIDLEYVPYGLKQGILLSAVSIAAFAGIMLLRGSRTRKQCGTKRDGCAEPIGTDREVEK